MRFELTTKVPIGDAVLEWAMPSDVEAQFLPAVMMVLSAAPDIAGKMDSNANTPEQREATDAAFRMGEKLFALLDENVQELITGGDDSDAKRNAIGMTLLSAEVSTVLYEAFEKSVIGWSGMEDGSGKEIPCTDKRKAGLPLLFKVGAALCYGVQVVGLQEKKAPLT